MGLRWRWHGMPPNASNKGSDLMAEATLICGGTVVDGTGSPARTADVLIENGVVVAVGKIDAAGAKIVDADGLLVTPGWVDVHTHYDGQVYWDALMTPSSWHGATTAVMGNCGVGFAPARPDEHESLIALMHQIEDIPTETLRAGVPWGWETFSEYIECLDRTPRAIDVGVLVPHGVVRTYVMGERGVRGKAAAEEIAAIAGMIGEAIDAGALGCSANRTLRKEGVVPGSFAEDDELLAMAKIVGEREAIFQTSPASFYGPQEWTPYEAECDLMRRMSLMGNMRLTFPLVQDHGDPDRWRRILEMIEAANEEGARLIPQVLARPLNAVMTLSGRHPFDRLPAYVVAVRDVGGTAGLALRLGEPTLREKILAEARKALADRAWLFDSLYPMTDPPDYEPAPDQSIGAAARRGGLSPMEAFYDAMLQNHGDAMFLMVAANYAGGNGDVVLEMIQHPATILGLGDGGAHCLGLCDATTPTTVLSHWARDRSRGPRLPVEIAVRELTTAPARAFGLYDRGALLPGMRADLNLIDLDALRMRVPEFVHDLPGNARRLVQRASGYVATYVAGTPVFENGEETGARPGRTIRKAPA
jgi:N-acyl-D-aspartate/D-glutamate deacylase